MKYAVIMILVPLLAGCREEKTTQPQEQSAAKLQSEWKQGEVVELTGTIHSARTDAKYFIETSDGRGVSIRSDAIDKLGAGTMVWVKGTIEYVHHPKPKDYLEDKVGEDKIKVIHGVAFPQTICYINVAQYRILTPQRAHTVPRAVHTTRTSVRKHRCGTGHIEIGMAKQDVVKQILGHPSGDPGRQPYYVNGDPSALHKRDSFGLIFGASEHGDGGFLNVYFTAGKVSKIEVIPRRRKE